ncbi:DUF1778 domain-containing protein [Actimicrobium sp. CCC2.4]|uniref:type II toxin-antitoxin system TacA family antitoxin n=1 Tax=Actimicrobium sp. CCC2.4 TaxID=3048606 RepID=UPI002AC89E45|nr:DUF1778 domain-containing protein [Actimicrobium sp. CCC2.4]MEB0135216.1 DUF1778 domain-containing protein [Actimicrobium sp. CCC2.4]WPX31012.1 DUF1778 domain-containing protein [Actimicrobium sp. CCC2.4]
MDISTTATITVRMSVDVRELIDRAAALQNKIRTDFMLDASCIAARQVLLAQVFFQISEEQMKAFDAVTAEPMSKNAAIQKLLASRSPWERSNAISQVRFQ